MNTEGGECRDGEEQVLDQFRAFGQFSRADHMRSPPTA